MLDSRKILNKIPPRPIKLSVYFNGGWMFVVPTGTPRVGSHQELYYQMTHRFGTVDQWQVNPAVTIARGNPGDYLVVGGVGGDYGIMSQTDFNILFPIKITIPPLPHPRGSSMLSNPKFLETVIQEYADNSYDTVSTTASFTPAPSTGGGAAPPTGGGGY
jgi:hypothetical protein